MYKNTLQNIIPWWWCSISVSLEPLFLLISCTSLSKKCKIWSSVNILNLFNDDHHYSVKKWYYEYDLHVWKKTSSHATYLNHFPKQTNAINDNFFLFRQHLPYSFIANELQHTPHIKRPHYAFIRVEYKGQNASQSLPYLNINLSFSWYTP